MNLTPIIRQLDREDFQKMLQASTLREQLYLRIARLDPAFGYHIDLPGEDSSQFTVGSSQPAANGDVMTENCELRTKNCSPLSDMPGWLADEKRFPHD